MKSEKPEMKFKILDLSTWINKQINNLKNKKRKCQPELNHYNKEKSPIKEYRKRLKEYQANRKRRQEIYARAKDEQK